MKVAIIAPIAFVIGLAGGTFAMRGHAPPATAADSQAVAPGDSTPHADPAKTVAEPPVVVDTGAHPGTATVPPPAPAATAPDERAAPADAPARNTEEDRRTAQILTKLPAADAAMLAKGMGDDELIAVLGFMDMSHAGGVLAALPPDRAANISKRILKSAAGKPQ